MFIADLVFIAATVIWLSEFVFFGNRSSEQTSELQERGSFFLILAAVLISVIASLLFREWQWTLVPNNFLLGLGLLIYVSGITLRFWAMVTLREHFSREIRTSATMELVSSGPYRSVRHPLYTGLFLCVLGVAVYTQTIAGIIVSLIFMTAVLLKRIRLEEQMLEEALPTIYSTWKKRRWILLPWFY